MSLGLRAAVLFALMLPATVGCGTLNTGNRTLDRTFNKAETATEKPAKCFLVTGLATVFGWLWLRDGTLEYTPSAPGGEKVSLGWRDD